MINGDQVPSGPSASLPSPSFSSSVRILRQRFEKFETDGRKAKECPEAMDRRKSDEDDHQHPDEATASGQNATSLPSGSSSSSFPPVLPPPAPSLFSIHPNAPPPLLHLHPPPSMKAKNDQNCLRSAGPKPQVPPKPKGLTKGIMKKMEEEEEKEEEKEKMKSIKEDEEGGKKRKEEEGRRHTPPQKGMFSRANSVLMRPKCKPPVPTEEDDRRRKAEEAGSDREMEADEGGGAADGGQRPMSLGSAGPPCPSSASTVRKPSARPPPPPVEGRKAAKVEAAPKPPANPPPPPPVMTSASTLPRMKTVKEDGGGGKGGGGGGNIYEEIEWKPEEPESKTERPKFRKRTAMMGDGSGRHSPPQYYRCGRGRERERRRTTQLEQWGRREKEEEGKTMMEEEDEEEEKGGEEDEQQHQHLPFSRSLPPTCSCAVCSSSSSFLSRSMFLNSSATLDRSPSFRPRRMCELEHRLGRFRSELRLNLAKRMGKLRSRVPPICSSSSSSSPTHFGLGKVLLFQDNFRNLNLARRKMMWMKGRRKEKVKEEGPRSEFYVEEEEEEGGREEGGREEEEEKKEEEDEEYRFGDDWSESSSSEGKGEGEEWEDEGDGRKRRTKEEGGEAEDSSLPTPISTAKQNEEGGKGGEGRLSLWEEIESDYQRLRQAKDKSHHPRCHSHSSMDQMGTSSVIESQIPRTASPPPPLNPSASCSSASSSSSSLSPAPDSLYSSSLSALQPLYQIYMLQEQRVMIGPGGADHPSLSSIDDPLASLRLETIEEVAGGGGGEDGGMRAETKRRMTNETEGQEKETADSVCNDPAGDTGSVSSASAVNVRRHSSTASSTDSGRDSLSRVSHTPNTPNSASSTVTPVRRERLLGGSVYGSQRSLWCELPEVKEAGLLDQMDGAEKKLQEAYFEVITSEASYLRSLSFLISHFMSAPELLGSKHPRSVITNSERKQLFSNIVAIRDCSERLLCELETRLRESLVLKSLCDILCDHFERHFGPYVNYCSNQVYQDRTLKALKANNPLFLACVQRLEADRQCQGLDMRSFLMLPMQRVTRYPLLVFAILDRLHPEQLQHSVATRALTLSNQVVRNCNEGARKMERTEQLLEIDSKIVYKGSELRRMPLVSSARYVVKSGHLTQLVERRGTRTRALGTMLQGVQPVHASAGTARALKTRTLALFLFSDLLLVTKPRLNGTFACKDYALRRFVVIEPIEANNARVPPGALQALGGCTPHLLFCVLLQNARDKQTEMLLHADSESDRERWLSAMRPPTCANPNEKIYAEWDCPQAIAVHNYEVQQEDELGLGSGDLVNILRKMPDGWFYGERSRDGKRGWFPSSYVQQVMNDHVRANNYRQRLRIMQSTPDFRLQNHRFGTDNKRFSALGLSASSAGDGTIASHSQQHNEPLLMSRLRRLSHPKTFFGT